MPLMPKALDATLNRKPSPVLALLALLSLHGCGGGGGGGSDNGNGNPQPPVQDPPVSALAFVPTTDFTTGSYSTINLRDRSVSRNLPATPGIIESDNAAVYFNQRAYVLNRFGFDSVTVLELADLTTAVKQFSTGNGSNPQDISFVRDDLAYVSLLASNDLLVVDSTAASGAEITGRIDLAPLLDPADTDGLVEATTMSRVGRYLFVVLQNLDNFAVTRPGTLAVVDTTSNMLVDTDATLEGTQGIELAGRNPVALTFVSDVGRLLVSSSGAFDVSDGGVESVDPYTWNAEGFLLTGADLGGGDLGDVVAVGGSKAYVVSGGFDANDVYIFDLQRDPDTGQIRAANARSIGLALPFIPGLALDEGNRLLVPDRTLTSPGLRLFDTFTDSEITVDPIDVGLPPNTPVVVPPSPPRVFVPTTDFTTGSYSTVNLSDRSAARDLPSRPGIAESDSAAVYYRDRVYVINRFGFDNISVLDTDNLSTAIRQFSTGNGSNPQDMAFVSDRQAYISLLGENDLLLVDPRAAAGNEITGRIDLAPLLDPADTDGLVEGASLVRVGRFLFIALQNLDNFVAARPGLLAVIDTATDSLVDVDPGEPGIQGIRLTGSNPVALRWSPELGKLLVSQAGNFGIADGGVESVDPFLWVSDGFLIGEAELGGGDVGELQSVGGRKVYVVAGGFDANDVQVFDVTPDPERGTLVASAPRSLGLELPFVPGLAIDSSGQLVVPDRTLTAPGLRLIDTLSDIEITTVPIDVGLPPLAPVILYR